MAKSIAEKVDLLQKQVDQIQMKLLEEKKVKWYKNPSLIISLIALSSSIIFSLITLVDTMSSKKEETTKGQIAIIKSSIEKMLTEEQAYNQQISNQYADQQAKNNAWMHLTTNLSVLSEQIQKNNINEHINQIEPNLLINYGKLLYMNSNFDLALDIIHNTLANTTDSLTKSFGYKWLGRIYSDRRNFKFDSIASRKYRLLDIKIGRLQEGENKYGFLSTSYEYWALDEYNNIKNITFGNALIDSAKYYIQQISNNQEKEFALNRLQETYNFYNDVITSYNIVGEYNLTSEDGKKGIAFINKSFNGYSLEFEHFENSKLTLKLTGDGKFSGQNSLRFEVETEEYSEDELFPDRSEGILRLTTEKNKILRGELSMYNKAPVTYTIVKR